jgi:hypothetical protein
MGTMAVQTERDPNNGAIRTRFIGKYSEKEFTEALVPFYASAPRGSHLFLFIDFRTLTKTPAAEELLQTLAELGKTQPKIPVLAAVLARSDMGLPRGKLLRPIMSNVGLRLMVFEKDQEAINWLLSGLE